MSDRALDRQGRWRCRTVSFRMSNEEIRELDLLVSISGLTKQDYIISRLLEREITVIPSSRIQKHLIEDMREMCRELRSVSDKHKLEPELQESISTLIEVFMALNEEAPAPQVEPMLRMMPNGQLANTSTFHSNNSLQAPLHSTVENGEGEK